MGVKEVGVCFDDDLDNGLADFMGFVGGLFVCLLSWNFSL